MTVWIACVAALIAPVQEDLSGAPPVTVVVIAQTGNLENETAAAFKRRLDQLKAYADHSRPELILTGEYAGLERWTFQVPATAKFDPTHFGRAFAGVVAKQFLLTVTGKAKQDPQTKIIFITSAGGKARVKLMNRPRDLWKPDEKVKDVVRGVSESIANGGSEFTVTGEIYNSGGTLAILLEEWSSLSGEPRPTAEPETPRNPPFTVVVTAKTKFCPPKKLERLQERLNRIKAYASQAGRSGVPGDTAGWEEWKFQIAGESKFDPTIVSRAFGDIQCRKHELTLSGTATQDPQTRIIFITAFGGKAKVKLMNRPTRDSNPDETVPDQVGAVSSKIGEGREHFTVTGEIFNHGGTLAILLESFSLASAPKK